MRSTSSRFPTPPYHTEPTTPTAPTLLTAPTTHFPTHTQPNQPPNSPPTSTHSTHPTLLTLPRNPTPEVEIVAELPAVTLAKLNAQAELLVRRDRKYPLYTYELGDALAAVAGHAQVLEIAGQRSFNYLTTYFDTPDLLCYQLTATRRRHRFKVRVREYENGDRFCEVKTSAARGVSVKDRIRWNQDAATGIPLDKVAAYLRQRGIDVPDLRSLAPKLEVRYRRITLLLAGSRVTIDTDLSWGAPGELTPVDGWAIIETKTNGAATLLDRALWKAGRRPRPLSKFGMGMAKTYGLSGNRWHRLLLQN